MLFGNKPQSKCIFLNYSSWFHLSSSQVLNVKNNHFFFSVWHFVGNYLPDTVFLQLKVFHFILELILLCAPDECS